MSRIKGFKNEISTSQMVSDFLTTPVHLFFQFHCFAKKKYIKVTDGFH